MLLTLPWLQRYRFRRFMSQEMQRMRPPTALIANVPLERDISNALTSNRPGVHILWAPEGCGKTTHVREVCCRLIEEKKLSGVVFIRGAETDGTPNQWLSAALKDGLPGALVTDATSFATLIPPPPNAEELPPPVAIVIDQIENVRRTDSMNRLIKSLAEESVLAKTFIFLVITKDAAYARGLIEVNGRTKIRYIGDSSDYKWSQVQVDEWLKSASAEGHS